MGIRAVGAGIVLAVLALAGCGGDAHPRAAVSSPVIIPPVPPSSTIKPRIARPGAVCGKVTTETRATVRVIVVRGRVTCPEAVRIFQKYYAPQTPAEGAAGLAVVDHWTCEKSAVAGAKTTCRLKQATIETRTR